MKKNLLEIAVLGVYTFLNLRLMWPLLWQKNLLLEVAIKGYGTYIAIFIALFLNASLVLYWLRYSEKA